MGKTGGKRVPDPRVGNAINPICKDALVMGTQNYYDTLGLDRRASGAEIKAAYRRLAQRYHPDVSGFPDGETRFKAVAEAYRTLKRVETRAAYDLQEAPAWGGALGGDPDPLQFRYALFLLPCWNWYWRQ